jgi:hypothetical protein
MARRSGRLRGRYSFKLGDVFPPEDKVAAYVMRLSMALGDLRIVADYATRARQSEGERVYFVRLFALHMREVANLLDPPDHTIIPTVDEFLAAIPRGTKPSRTEIRKYHAKVMRRLRKPMKGRAEIEIRRRGKPTTRRVPTLRDELKRLRDDFAHYGHNAEGADAVKAAMASASEIRTGYAIREHKLRAQYADTVAMTLTHPFELDNRKLAGDMHGRIIDLVEPVASYIQCIEAAITTRVY